MQGAEYGNLEIRLFVTTVDRTAALDGHYRTVLTTHVETLLTLFRTAKKWQGTDYCISSSLLTGATAYGDDGLSTMRERQPEVCV